MSPQLNFIWKKKRMWGVGEEGSKVCGTQATIVPKGDKMLTTGESKWRYLSVYCTSLIFYRFKNFLTKSWGKNPKPIL